MALDTKVGVQAEIDARKLALPSGVFVEGSELHGTFTRKAMIDEICDICDAILALVSSTDEVMESVSTWRTVITDLRNNKVGFLVNADGASVIRVLDSSGVIQRGALLDRHPRLAGLLSVLVLNTAQIMNSAYGASDAVTLAMDLLQNTAAQKGSSVYVDGAEVSGVVSLREFRPLYLAALDAIAAAFPS